MPSVPHQPQSPGFQPQQKRRPNAWKSPQAERSATTEAGDDFADLLAELMAIKPPELEGCTATASHPLVEARTAQEAERERLKNEEFERMLEDLATSLPKELASIFSSTRTKVEGSAERANTTDEVSD